MKPPTHLLALHPLPGSSVPASELRDAREALNSSLAFLDDAPFPGARVVVSTWGPPYTGQGITELFAIDVPPCTIARATELIAQAAQAMNRAAARTPAHPRAAR